MLVVFRADASLYIGSGHIMRCLTLADELREKGNECHFMVRANKSDRIDEIRRRGHVLHVLPIPERGESQKDLSASKNYWLDCTWQEDAKQAEVITHLLCPDWIVVDHYGLDISWETIFRKSGTRVLAIDDLADREHSSDLLLDQNLGRTVTDYTSLTPVACAHLVGPQFALLRPEFAAFRDNSFKRRTSSQWPLRHILISMGGVDKDDLTSDVLASLSDIDFPRQIQLTVVMGAGSPHLEAVKRRASEMARFSIDVHINVTNMAQMMAATDLAIGASGGTAWERCCLGLPSIIVIAAENQKPGAYALAASGAAEIIASPKLIRQELPPLVEKMTNPANLAAASANASRVCDGKGAARVASAMVASRVDYVDC